MAYSVDTTIQYRGYNTFKMVAPARVKSWMYGVEGLDTISHGLYVYCPTNQAAAVRAKTRWINADGITHSVVDHSFAIEAGLFSWVKIEAVPVPVGAVQAVTEIVNTSGATYWAGLIKTEAGNTATDFTENKAGQLTKITAAGIYTGTIQATQVVVANERLPDVLTSIQAGRITLSDDTKGKIAGMTVDTTSLTFSSTNSYFRITSDGASDFIRAGTSSSDISFRVDKNGKLYATGAVIDGDVTARRLQSSTSTGYAKIGNIIGSAEGIEFIGSTGGKFMLLNTLWAGTGLPAGFGINATNEAGYYTQVLRWRNNGDLSMYPGGGAWLLTSNDYYITHPKGCFTELGTDFVVGRGNTHYLGIDSGGPYFIKSGVKKYFT